jgi:ABC-2 type transport system permease protein
MDRVLFARTLQAQRTKLFIVAVALVIWGLLMPLIYSELIDTPLGAQFKQMIDSGLFPARFANFGGSNVFTLPGAIALGFIHPIFVAIVGVFAMGFTAAAVAGERQRGTLEVVLARPISRRTAYGSLLGATIVMLGLAILAMVAGTLASAAVFGKLDELDVGQVPLLWLNTVLLYLALGSVALAASVSFDRLAPALGITLGFTLVSYFLQILGSLWPDAEPLQPFSLFHYLDPAAILDGKGDPFDLVLLAVVTALAVAWALVVFPRRDLAAPS